MARTSYLARRDGRYVMRARFAVQCVPLVGKALYRASLGTSDYRVARRRLTECLGWLHRMNDSVDYPTLFQRNVAELRAYLQDVWPISDERLFARRNYEELLKNLNRRAQAAGFSPDMTEPDFPTLLKAFVQQNVEAEAYLQKAERVREYERGRSDMQAAVQFGAVPASFQMPSSMAGTPPPGPLVIPPSQPAPVTIPSSLGNENGTDPTASSPRFSEALAEYLEKAGGSADGRRDVEMIIQFLIDQMNDRPVGLFTAEQAKALDKMLPDIPDRNGIPRNQCVTLSMRYQYAQQHGWIGLKRLTEARLRNGYQQCLVKIFRLAHPAGILQASQARL